MCGFVEYARVMPRGTRRTRLYVPPHIPPRVRSEGACSRIFTKHKTRADRAAELAVKLNKAKAEACVGDFCFLI